MQPNLPTVIILILLATVAGVVITYLVISAQYKVRSAEAAAAVAEAERRNQLADTSLESRYKELQVEAREEVQREVQRLRETIEKETSDRRAELKEGERRLRDRETQLERRMKLVEQRDKNLDEREAEIAARLNEAAQVVLEQKKELSAWPRCRCPKRARIFSTRRGESRNE
jgi:ribonuclease Y